ncbi:dihydrofolate reductase family protein [Spirilliplanes yamanashiensis]|uniref:Deaminase n=1 Tax=Spirilliplanes yamanashiensis TaxID=42233 RepID=A0A8J3YAS2_9ACTN|nr:dihydrofolate reductase family protein [Spirilliplanes yamanashiensis]MDP9817535.1 dihydrofolate reductase [Spirilliplanes yamanashiensis]GIJ04345.1 deaminase [Spirilliplanes yamanashiensis]
MGKLVYSMITSVDGYVSDPAGGFEWAGREEVHRFVNEASRAFGTYLVGRRMYEVMSYWETAHLEPGQPDVALEYARIWQAADKVVYSTTLETVGTARTRLERTFDPDAVRALKERSERDLTVDGPTLAAHALRAGLVDEVQLYVGPAVVGGGLRFFPDGVRSRLELLDEQRLAGDVLFLRYALPTLAA